MVLRAEMKGGNAISAAFTALWRGLGGDELSADIASSILAQKHLSTMRTGRFAPALRALVGARAYDVDTALLALLDGGQDQAKSSPCANVDAAVFAQYLAGDSSADPIAWEQRWEYLDRKNDLQTLSTVHAKEASSDGEAVVARHVPMRLPQGRHVVVSLGSGFDVRCQENSFGACSAWIRVDRAVVQQCAIECCRLSRGCQKCAFIEGDVCATSTGDKILKCLAPRSKEESDSHGTSTIWLAEGLMEYLKPEQQRSVLQVISRVQAQLNGVGYLIFPILDDNIEQPLRDHYGAQFGWKFSDLDRLRALLTDEGWRVKETKAMVWGSILEASMHVEE